MPIDTEEFKLSDSILSFIDKWKNKPGNLIMVLHKVQQEYGYIPRKAAIALTEALDTSLAKIYGVITFYHFFKLEKPGRHTISVCMGTACYLKGGEDLVHELEDMLGIGINCTTDDEEFSLQAVRCVGCCGLAPVMMVGDEVFGKLTKDDLPEILSRFRGK